MKLKFPSIFPPLKRLYREIDLKNVDKFTELGLTKGRGWVLNFLGAPMILSCKSLFIAVNASMRWLNNVSCLFLSFLLITKGI
jgi:hypothetical protein